MAIVFLLVSRRTSPRVGRMIGRPAAQVNNIPQDSAKYLLTFPATRPIILVMANRIQIGRPVGIRHPFNGNRLRKLRVGRNLSAARLAVLVGCVEATILNWESGATLPANESVKALANALRVRAGSFRPSNQE